MNQLTGKEIINKLRESNIDLDQLAYGDYNSKELGLGESEQVEQHGGEDEGSNWYSIKYFKDHDVYIKIRGFYASHVGTDFYSWDDVYEVKPAQKTITVYESINNK